jgi:hypothetical protein
LMSERLEYGFSSGGGAVLVWFLFKRIDEF